MCSAFPCVAFCVVYHRPLLTSTLHSVIEVQEDNVQQLLPAAGLLRLESVVSACCQFLEAELHPSNCLGVKQFADLHSCTALYKAAEAFSKRRFTEVSHFPGDVHHTCFVSVLSLKQ